jgi:hypothetical protein
MPTLLETVRPSDVILWEVGEEVAFTRATATLISGTVASVTGQILGQITASGKYTQLTTGASDGSQVAAGILLTPNTATLAADATVAIVARGPAILKATGIAYTAGMTGGQKTTAATQLAALGITIRNDYGV